MGKDDELPDGVKHNAWKPLLLRAGLVFVYLVYFMLSPCMQPGQACHLFILCRLLASSPACQGLHESVHPHDGLHQYINHVVIMHNFRRMVRGVTVVIAELSAAMYDATMHECVHTYL